MIITAFDFKLSWSHPYKCEYMFFFWCVKQGMFLLVLHEVHSERMWSVEFHLGNIQTSNEYWYFLGVVSSFENCEY